MGIRRVCTFLKQRSLEMALSFSRGIGFEETNSRQPFSALDEDPSRMRQAFRFPTKRESFSQQSVGSRQALFSHSRRMRHNADRKRHGAEHTRQERCGS
jgi:hypothetical protein